MRKIARNLFALLLLTVPIIGQSQVATGQYEFGTFDNKGFDTINVGNLNVMFALPILAKQGRAGTNFAYQLGYNSSVWSPQAASGAQTWTPASNWGWQGQSEVLTGYISEISHSYTVCNGIKTPWTLISGVGYRDNQGRGHTFTGHLVLGPCTQETDTLTGTYSTDGQYQYTARGIVSRNGILVNAPVNTTTGPATYTDNNGNEISTDGNGNFVDTTGNTVLTVTGAAPSPEIFTFKDANGHNQTVTVTYTAYSVKTNFGCSGVSEYSNSSVPLITAITYPDSSHYNFTYESTPGTPGSVTGRLASVSLPSGGVITYTYTGSNNGIECSDGSTAGLTRKLPDDSNGVTTQWTYARTIGTSTSQTLVTDGLSNQTNYTFISSAPVEVSRSVYQGIATGTALLSRNTCYNGASSSNCASSVLAPYVYSISTYETLNGLQEHGSDLTYNNYGFLTNEKDYNFGGSSGRGALLRQETWAYPTTGIVGLLQSDIVADGSGNTLAKTTYLYDQTTPVASSGVPQHVAITGQRGNLTSLVNYASSGTSYITKYTYEDTGSVLTAVSPVTTSGATTTLGYDSSFVYNTSVQLPTPSSGVALSYTQSYDQTSTGLPLTFTDPNGQQTIVQSYNSVLRPNEITSPASGKAMYSYASNYVDVQNYMSSSTYEDTHTTIDPYGRTEVVAVQKDASDWYQTTYCYDGNGNLSFKSYPALNQTGCSLPGETYSHDALGRVTKVLHADGTYRTAVYSGRTKQSFNEAGNVQRLTQTDGLGRISAVCEISSGTTLVGSSAPVACGMDFSGTGYVASYAYSNNVTTVSQGAQTRTFTTDWLGRTTSMVESESGTTSFAYSVNSTGPVVTRTKPRANQTGTTTTTTTTQYDVLNRPISITYNDGTPNKTFDYDVVNSAMQWTAGPSTHPKGHLVDMASGSGSTLTRALFSYDPAGRILTTWQCGPSICGTANQSSRPPVSYAYDWAGNLTGEGDGIAGVIDYTRSQAGEVTSITNTSASPAALVSSVTNGPDGPVSYSLGNGLSQYYGYDTLGRLQSGWVCVGAPSSNCSSQLYGFDLNSRKGDEITSVSDDVMGSASYTYNEFGWLQSTSNTTGEQYSYAYDRHGNRWQQNPLQGGISVSVSYTQATNQISTAGYHYDAAGNMTSDSFHTYTFDAEGNVTAVDAGSTAQYVYDALNRRVRVQTASATDEYLFDAANHHTSEWVVSSNVGDEGWIYWGARLIAFRSSDGNTYFSHTDWQGTERIRTTATGALAATYGSLPYGDGYTVNSTNTPAQKSNPKFALLDRDPESSTHHGTFRQYSPTLAQWLSPDPYYGSYNLGDPNSLGRYNYVENNPIAYVDPDGTTGPCDGSGAGCAPPCDPSNNCFPQPPVYVNGNPPPPPPPPTDPDPCGAVGSCSVGQGNGGQGNGSQSGGGGNGTAASNKPQQAQKPPCSTTTRIAGAVKAAEAAGDASIAYNLSAIHFGAAGVLFTLGCLDPTPFDAVTCVPSAAGSAFFGAGGLILGHLGNMEVEEGVIPGIKQAVTCTP